MLHSLRAPFCGRKFVLWCCGLLWLAGWPLVAPAQQRRPLLGGWEFVRQDLGGIWEAVRPVGAGNPESVPLWQPVTLPHCFNAQDAVDPDVNYYQGPGWYRTQLVIDNPYPQGRTLLHFEGAGQKTAVYVYTTKVAEHVGGYDEWTADLTEAVAAFRQTPAYAQQFKGRVPVSIRCDNSRDLEMIPSNLSDFNVYGGLYRYLHLEYQPAVSVEHVFAQAEVDAAGRQGRVRVRARLRGSAPEATVQVQLLDARGKVVGRAETQLHDPHGDVPVADLSLPHPRLWSPDAPTLYTVRVQVRSAGATATEQTQVGFRHFEFVEHGPFRLNGQRLLLRGTHRHEDHAGVGAAMTAAQTRQEMRLMKQMGVNFIRLGHYQQAPLVLQLCDSLGILVWEEIPWCRGGLGGSVYQAQARRMLTNMVEQHYNHPSIIIWGLGNENDWPGDFPTFDEGQIRAFMTELNTLAHQLDPARRTAIRRCDFCKDIVDVYSPSIWAGWYRGTYTEYQAVARQEMARVPHFFHAEWGGDSHAGRHSETPDRALASIGTGGGADERAGDASLYGGAARVSKDGDWSETYICNLIDWHLKEQENMPWLTGSAYWPFKDFSTPVRPDNPVPYVNQKGVTERDLTPKESYYVFQSYWTTRPMVHIYGHSWPIRWGEVGEEKLVRVYSNCAEAELWLNGRSYGSRRRNSQDFPAAGLHWKLAFRPGLNHLRVVARQGRQMVEDSIRFAYQTAKWGPPARLTLEKVAEAAGAITLEARLLDAQGIPCLDAANWVRFSLAGGGQLLENLGTSSGARKVQLANGRARIRVQLRGARSVVGVQAEGLPVAFVQL